MLPVLATGRLPAQTRRGVCSGSGVCVHPMRIRRRLRPCELVNHPATDEERGHGCTAFGVAVHQGLQGKCHREAHLPTQRPSSCQATRLPQPHVHTSRASHRRRSPPTRKEAAVRLIGRVRGRRAFRALHADGRRARVGPLRVTFLADTSELPCVAFSIGRALGPAVVRNRARRVLRAGFADLVRDRPALVPPGTYLVGLRRAHATPEELRRWLTGALEQLATP